jgi:methyl-accepting chemotaxis protein
MCHIYQSFFGSGWFAYNIINTRLQLSSMTFHNSENTQRAQSIIALASNSVVSSESSLDKVIAAIEQNARSGDEICKSIKTIDEIAFQTKLLALNAAAEAARACFRRGGRQGP